MVLEALRFSPPVAQCSEINLQKDVKIGKYTIKAKDDISVNIIGLHFHQDQWQRPREFIPERWDNSNPLSLTPSG